MSGGAGGGKLEGTTERFILRTRLEREEQFQPIRRKLGLTYAFSTEERDSTSAADGRRQVDLKHRKKPKTQTSYKYKPHSVLITHNATVDKS